MEYCICSKFGGGFNLVVWHTWLRSPNLMYDNTTCNHVYYEQCTLNVALFAKLKCPPMCMHYAPIRENYCSPNVPCIYDIYPCNLICLVAKQICEV